MTRVGVDGPGGRAAGGAAVDQVEGADRAGGDDLAARHHQPLVERLEAACAVDDSSTASTGFRVVKGDALVGIVTRSDLVRAFIRSDEEIEREPARRCSSRRCGPIAIACRST